MKQVVFLLLIGVAVGYLVHSNLFSISKSLHAQIPQIPEIAQNVQNVQGVSTSALPKDFGFIQKEIANLPVTQISTASPQIQSIIHLLQKMPKGQIKMVCQNVCNGIK